VRLFPFVGLFFRMRVSDSGEWKRRDAASTGVGKTRKGVGFQPRVRRGVTALVPALRRRGIRLPMSGCEGGGSPFLGFLFRGDVGRGKGNRLLRSLRLILASSPFLRSLGRVHV
jgi:hypothetical protein